MKMETLVVELREH